jgi:hypothetical protein
MPVIIAGVVIVGDAVTLADAVGVGSSALASPKSKTFTVPSGRSVMLAGFRSRWMMPASWALERVRDLLRDRQRFVGRDRAQRDPIGQRRAFHELQHQRAHAVRFFQTVDRADMRMIQRGKYLRFTFEASEAVRIGSECLGQDLERDVAIQLRIARAIHLAHAARPEQAQDFICAKPCTRRQSHEALLILATEPFRRKRESRSAQAAFQLFHSDCQQISAHPSERNASWMSARLSYRTRRRRNWLSQANVRSTTHRHRPRPLPCAVRRMASQSTMCRARRPRRIAAAS